MSGHSYSDPCPNCESDDTNFYQDHKPFQYIQFECLTCGMYSQIHVDQMDLSDLNMTRRDYGDYDDVEFIPLETQKPINKEWFSGFMKREDTHEKRIYAISYAYIQSVDTDVETIKKLSDKDFIALAEDSGMVWSQLEIFIDDLNKQQHLAIHRVIEVAK